MIVDVPEYGIEVEFPDNMSVDAIQKVMKEKFPPKQPIAAVEGKYGSLPNSPPEPPYFNPKGIVFGQDVSPIPVKNISESDNKAMQIFRPSNKEKEIAKKAISYTIKPFEQVGYSAAAAVNRGLAVFSTHLDTMSEYVADLTGTEKGKAFEDAAKMYNENTDYWKKRFNDVGTSAVNELLGGVIGGSVGIAEFLLTIPYAGLLGASEAHKNGSNELGGALVEAGKRGVLGMLFHAIAPLKQYLSTPLMGGIFGIQTAGEGGSTEEIAKSVGTGLLYGLASPGGRYGLNELRDMARSNLQKDIEKVQEIKPSIEEKPIPEPQLGAIEAPKPLDPLAEEARKYGSAEEFVEAQGEPVYHGTNAKFTDFNKELIGTNDNISVFGKGFYFSELKGSASKYGKNIEAYYLKIKNPIKVANTTEDLKNITGSISSKEAKQILQNKVIPSEYDGVQVFENGKMIEIVVRDSSKIKTKSQLTDIYNQAKSEGGKGQPSFAPQTDFRTTPEPSSIQESAPMGRSEIKQFLEDNLLVPMRTGRFRDKALGIFKLEPEVVRTKFANDIETISHEVGHALQKFLWPESVKAKQGAKGMSGSPFEIYKDELLPLATKPKEGQPATTEGFAEFTRLYITNRTKAQERAPQFYSYFESILNQKSPETKAIFDEANKKYQLYLKQPALQRVLSQISIGKKESKIPSIDSLYTKWIDDLHPLENIVKEMSQGKEVPISKDPYKLARLLRGVSGKAEAFLKHKPFDFKTHKDIPDSKSLKEILDHVRDNLDDFRAYVVSKRALELSNRGIETGIIKEDAKSIVKENDTKYAPIFEELKQFQNHVLTYLKDSGLLSKQGYKDIKEANQDYVPFYRVMDGQKNMGMGTGLQSRTGIKAIKGSWRDIVDPLESIVKNTHLFITLAEKNEVGTALVDLSKSKEGLGKFVEKIPRPMQRIEVKGEELNSLAKMIDPEGDLGIDLSEEIVNIFRPSAFVPKDGVISVWKNGERDLYQVPTELSRAYQALDKETMHTLFKILAYPASWLRAGATLTPEFMGRNPIRDQWSAFIFSKYGFVPGFDLVRGIFHMAKKDQVYWDFKKSGADHSMLVSMDRDYLQDNLGEILTKYPLSRMIKNPINTLRLLSELGEMGTRIGEFQRMEGQRSSKEDIQKSGFEAREVTLDFNRAGTAVRGGVNSIIAFSNAQIQDLNKIYRSFKDDPINTSIKVAVSITIPSIMLAMVNNDDPRYKDIPQWQRDLFWIVIPNRITQKEWDKMSIEQRNSEKAWITGSIWRIPKPFTMGILFGSVPERAVNYIMNKDPHAFDDMLSTLYRGFGMGVVPTAGIPIMENWANKSMYFDRKIVPRGLEDVLPEYQYGEYTSETAKKLGQIIGRLPVIGDTGAASPMYIENLVRGWSGGLGKYALDIFGKGLEYTGLAENKVEKPSFTEADMPFLKAFIVRYPSSDTLSIQRFYDNYDKANTQNKTVKLLVERGYSESAIRIWQESGMQDLTDVYQSISNITKVIKAIESSPDMNGDEKREQIDILYLQQTEIAGYGNKLYDEMKKVSIIEKPNPKINYVPKVEKSKANIMPQLK